MGDQELRGRHTVDLLAPQPGTGTRPGHAPLSQISMLRLGAGAPVSPDGPTSRGTMVAPGLGIGCAPALLALSRGRRLGSKEHSFYCHLALLSGARSSVFYLIGDLTWLLNNSINQTQLVLLELMSPGNAAVNNEGFCLSPSTSPHTPFYFFLRDTQQVLTAEGL